jgi:hypothetical protein
MPFELGLIYTIEVDGKPTVTFEARQLREAAELCHEAWFREKLARKLSNGVPIIRIASKLRARMANETERVIYQRKATTSPSDDISLVYLVELE